MNMNTFMSQKIYIFEPEIGNASSNFHMMSMLFINRNTLVQLLASGGRAMSQNNNNKCDDGAIHSTVFLAPSGALIAIPTYY